MRPLIGSLLPGALGQLGNNSSPANCLALRSSGDKAFNAAFCALLAGAPIRS
ncbi:MAG: hypothetical protein R2867_29620 [Caldilineaceae bacterium]